MDRRLIAFLALFMAVAITACQYGKEPVSGTPPEGFPAPDGKAFWTYISVTSLYTKWSFWPGYEGIYEGKSPHGAYLRLYANDIAINAAKAGHKTMPNGAIIIKENYGKDKMTLMAITPMYKVTGYNPEGGDWFWGKYSPSGKVEKAGKPKGCVDCHGAVKADDWLFSKPQ